MNWINWITNTSEFMTRNQCGPGWTDNQVSLYQFANAIIALAYFTIPLSLLALYVKIRKVRIFAQYNPWIITMFISFISLCGITHIGHVMVFYYPAYRLYTILDFITGVISLITAIILPLVISQFIRKLPNDE